MAETISFYIRDPLINELRTRGENRSAVINRDLDRLYTLYKRALREVPLTVAEAWLIVDTLNGTIMDANSARMLWASVEDAVKLDGLDKKWDVDGQALIEKLRKLNDIQALALVDAAERFWQECPQENLQDEVKKYFCINEER